MPSYLRPEEIPLPPASKTPASTRARNQRSAVEAVLDAATLLMPTPGYVNGTDYADWHVEATPKLLRALADLAHHHKEVELAEVLRRFSGPMCLEPLYDDLSEKRQPTGFCAAIVEREGEPCWEHSPENADALGRCIYPDRARLCREPRVPDRDRCTRHLELCLVVKRDGTVCGRRRCSVPKHKQIATAEAAAVPTPM